MSVKHQTKYTYHKVFECERGRLYSKTFQLPLQCRTLVLMRQVSVTLSFFRAYFNNHKKPQVSIQCVRKEKKSTSRPLDLNQETIFEKKGLKIPFPRLSQCAFKRIHFCDLHSFSPAFLAAMRFVSNRSEIDKSNQSSSYRSSNDLQVPILITSHYTASRRVSRRKNVSLNCRHI